MLIAFLVVGVMSASFSEIRSEAFARDVTDRLLSGQGMPEDLAERLSEFEPVERIKLIIFMRRVGVDLGPAWSADRILESAKEGGIDKR